MRASQTHICGDSGVVIAPAPRLAGAEQVWRLLDQARLGRTGTGKAGMDKTGKDRTGIHKATSRARD